MKIRLLVRDSYFLILFIQLLKVTSYALDTRDNIYKIMICVCVTYSIQFQWMVYTYLYRDLNIATSRAKPKTNKQINARVFNKTIPTATSQRVFTLRWTNSKLCKNCKTTINVLNKLSFALQILIFPYASILTKSYVYYKKILMILYVC